MSDRTSAGLFAMVFEMLAEDPTPKHKEFAAELWKHIDSYDFDPRQMYCDDALVTLGLARLGVDPEYPDDGEVYLYGPV